jgi:hypothetical protein
VNRFSNYSFVLDWQYFFIISKSHRWCTKSKCFHLQGKRVSKDLTSWNFCLKSLSIFSFSTVYHCLILVKQGIASWFSYYYVRGLRYDVVHFFKKKKIQDYNTWDLKILKSNEKKVKLNLINLLNPWLEILYYDNSIKKIDVGGWNNM